MRALTIAPGAGGSALVEEVPEPSAEYGSVLVETLAVGLCGTDQDIFRGDEGVAPPGGERLILGHESLGRVLEAPPDCGFVPGDRVVGIVRRPDPVPCPNCAAGEWDMCRNGRFAERGIKELHGFASERFRIEPEYAVKVTAKLGGAGVLLEPASVLAKAWDHIERIAARARWAPRRVLVTGAGPMGLLASMLGVQRGLEVHVLDRVTGGPKPGLVEALGAAYHTGTIREACEPADIVIECTGAGELVYDAMCNTASGGLVCLTGASFAGREATVDLGALNHALVEENVAVFGSVNANRRHYEAAAAALAQADAGWLEGLITRRVPLDEWAAAIEHDPVRDVKTVIDFAL